MDQTDWDELFDALRDVHRRRVLMALLELDHQDEAVKVPEEVHVGERGLEDLQLEMIHHHIPLLANAGYVSWNREDHEIQEGETFEDIRPILELLREHRDELSADFV